MTSLYLSKTVSIHLPVQYTCLASRITDEAFAAKYLPDLGHDVKDFKVFNWRLTNWRKLEKKLTSPEFECGSHKW